MRAKIALILIGMAMMAIAAIVLVRDSSIDTELLGTGLVLGAIAIAIVTVLLNGKTTERNSHD